MTVKAVNFLQWEGEAARLIRAFDWSATSLGSIEAWPQSLKTATALIVRSPVPIVMLWGSDGVMIYNDAYSVFAGGRHPRLLGQKVREAWPEVADFNANVMKVGLAGHTLSYKDQELTLYRNGKPEQVWMNLDYSPVIDESGQPAGVIAIVVETTQRILAERQRQEAEAMLRVERDRARGVLENMAEGFLLLDREFRVVDINAEGLRLENRARSEIIGKTQSEAWPSMAPSQVANICRQALADGVPKALEHLYTWSDGHEAWLDVRVYPNDDGVAIFYRDVTQRKRDEEALRISEHELRELNADLERQVVERSRERGRTWQVTPDLLSVIDSKGYFESVNPAWTPVLGWSQAELTHVPFLDFVHDEDRDQTEAAWKDALQGNPVQRFESRYRKKDGAYRWLSWVAVPEGGKVYCSARDITSEKEQASRLAESTAERDRLWRNTQDLQVVVDMRGTFQNVSPAVTRVLGWSAEEMIGRSAFDFVLPEDEASARDALQHARGQTLPMFEVRFWHKDGGFRWISWVAAPEGDLIYASGRHITAEKAQAIELATAQEALRQSQKMEAVGQLTGGLAHDFNNLLTGITGSLELLQARIAQGRINDVDRYVNAAQGAARRASALTHRLLAFSRRQTLEPKPTDINRLIAGMEELIKRTMGPEISIEPVTGIGLWVTLVDPSQLENALLNLCINARDAMPSGGKLSIETANRWLDERAAKDRDIPPGQYVSLCVSDNGTGMPPEVVARAFDPFYTTKPIGQGTGLGLSMIYGFVRQSGGQVRIYSEVGKGTMVCLYLPRHLGEAETAELPAELSTAPRAEQGETVLVVDDEPTVRMLVTEVLEDLGYTAIEATDGAAGLKVLQSDVRIDLLVTDVGLPGGMNGRQLADAALVSRQNLKVLFITGYAENAVLSHGHLAPGMEVMTKPFALEALATRIRNMIEARGPK
jgi:PAS domain S-box-containing protein